jgi:DNA modification methylase
MNFDVLKERYSQINELPITLADKIELVFGDLKGSFDIESIYNVFSNEKKTTIRGRIYRDLYDKGLIFKISKGIYSFDNGKNKGLILEGDARKLEQIKNESIHLIIADHPYPIQAGTNRNFNQEYKDTTFKYNQEDFNNKARVVIPGGFLVEFLPELKETNWQYINNILHLAQNAGFNFYAKVPWYKAEIRDGKLIDGSAFVGRKAVLEDIYIFTKGKPRKLRYRKQGSKMRNESGAKGMLPAIFMEPVRIPKKRIHMAEKPMTLLIKLIELTTNSDETVLDQFSGSFNAFFAAIESGRNAIAIELNKDFLPIKNNK